MRIISAQQKDLIAVFIEETRETARRHFERQGRRMPRGWRIEHPQIPTSADRWRQRAWELIGTGQGWRACRYAATAALLRPLRGANWWALMISLRVGLAGRAGKA